MNPSKAKQTIYVLFGAIMLLGLVYAGIAKAKQKPTQTLVFRVESLKPLNTTPYGVYKIVPTPIPSKVTSKPKTQPRKDTTYDKPSIGQNYGAGEVQDLIRKYSQQYGISPETPLCIAQKESGFNPSNKNKSLSASGVFQYLNSTWHSTDEGKAGLSVLNADANIRAAVKYMAIHKSTKPWTVHAKCPPLQFL